MFNKETEYAIRSLVYIKLQNLKNKRPGTAEISKETEAPPFFVAKILQRLVREGYLRSQKGKGGGFFFDEKKKDLPLATLISATEGNDSLSSCVFGLKECRSENPCPLHDRYAPIRFSLSSLLTEETIGGLAEKLFEKEQKTAKTKA